MNMGAFQFAQPMGWIWLALAALTAVLVAVGLRRRRRLLLLMAEHPLLARLAPSLDLGRAWVRAGLAALAMVALSLGLMDPRWGLEVEQVQRHGMDTIFVIDVSWSMMAEDATPSRLERAKQFALDASETLDGDRVGLVDYAREATVRTPLTLNYAAFRQAVRDLEPRGGSKLGDAIRRAAENFPRSDKGARAIVVLSDGGGDSSAPAEAARMAFEESGIRVFTVGIGDDRFGGRVPQIERDGQRRYTKSKNGEEFSKMNPDTLREVAKAGGGAFIPAGTAQLDMAAVYHDSLAGLDRVDQESSLVKRQTPRFQWFAGAALLLLVLESLITDRRAAREARA